DQRGDTLRVSDPVSWMIRSPAIGAAYSSYAPVRFHENATSRPSGERSIPPQNRSTLGSPPRIWASSLANREPSGIGRKLAAGATRSAGGFAMVVGGDAVPRASQSS